MKNLLQQRHLRRVRERLIVHCTSTAHGWEENEKEEPEKHQTGRRKQSFAWKSAKKSQLKNTEFQTANSPPLSFRR
jgi:hypothetical protein